MTYAISNGPVGAQPIASSSSTQQHPLGTIVRAEDPVYGSAEFIYLKGLDLTVAGSFVTYNRDDGSTTLLVKNAIGPVAKAMYATVTGYYGWYMISGKASDAVTAGAVADNADLYCTTGTNGSIDDAVVTGQRIWGAKAASASTAAGSIEVELDRPFVTNAINSGTS